MARTRSSRCGRSCLARTLSSRFRERYCPLRLERLPSSAGISPLKSLPLRYSICQVGEAAQLRRYLPAQAVEVEVQFSSPLRYSPLRLERLPNSRRYLPAQGVIAEVPVALSGWRGCPAPPVSPRSSRFRGGTALSGWRGCPAPAVSPRSSRYR